MNHDPLNPTYYKVGEFDLIDLLETMQFSRANAVKYIARAGLKNPDTELEDLKKAAWYVSREISRIERETNA